MGRRVSARRVGALRTVVVAAAMLASTLGVSVPAAAQTQPFSDISEDAYYSKAVVALAGGGVFDGTECGEGMLCPGVPIDRKTMAVWTVRALDGQDPAEIPVSRFSDVAAGSFYGSFIERMAELGVTAGCGDGTVFCPDGTVTRDQMAVFLTRAFDLDAGPDPGFSDVADDVWYYEGVAALAASGITAGCGDGTAFCPRRHTTRAQMATFLARATGLVSLPTSTPAVATYRAVAAASSHSCAIAVDDSITCWGTNRYGQSDAPAGTYKAIALGEFHSCAIRTDDTIACWGLNDAGQTDAPEGTYKAVTADGFVPIEGAGPNAFTCAIRTDDTLTCWGDNWAGRTDAPAGTYKAVAVGKSHGCAIATDDSLTCWGGNWAGQSDAPAGTYKAITVGGWSFTCAIRTDDTLTCWGDNRRGQTDVPAGTYKAITAGRTHGCAIATDDSLTCWGGNPRRDERPEQIDAPAGTYKAITTGDGSNNEWEGLHTCALRTDGAIICWGDNGYGQSDAPAGTYKTVTVGEYHSCGLRTDDTVVCWGDYIPAA